MTADAAPAGLECPECGGKTFGTIQTRSSPKFGGCIERRKQCRACAEKIFTIELDRVVVETSDIEE